MKHIRTVSKAPVAADSGETNLEFLLAFVQIGFDLLTTFFTAFSAGFTGIMAAISAFLAAKNAQQG